MMKNDGDIKSPKRATDTESSGPHVSSQLRILVQLVWGNIFEL